MNIRCFFIFFLSFFLNNTKIFSKYAPYQYFNKYYQPLNRRPQQMFNFRNVSAYSYPHYKNIQRFPRFHLQPFFLYKPYHHQFFLPRINFLSQIPYQQSFLNKNFNFSNLKTRDIQEIKIEKLQKEVTYYKKQLQELKNEIVMIKSDYEQQIKNREESYNKYLQFCNDNEHLSKIDNSNYTNNSINSLKERDNSNHSSSKIEKVSKIYNNSNSFYVKERDSSNSN
jgi:hypothetical protein